MGLLDILSGNASDGATQGLLSLGAGLLQGSGRGASFGQSLGMGIQNMQQTLAEAERRKQEKAVSDLQAKLLGFKVQDAESDVANQKMVRERAAAIAAELMGGGNGAPAAAAAPAQSFASAMPGGEGSPRIGGPEWMQSFQQQAPAVATPAPQAAASPAGDIRTQQAERLLQEAEVFRRHGDLDGAKQRYDAAAKLQPEYDATPQIFNGPNGPVLVQLSKTAPPRILDGFKPREKLSAHDIGGQLIFANDYDGSVSKQINKTQTPDGAVNAGIARANLNLSAKRLALEENRANKPTFNAEAGGFVVPPSAANPTGKLIPLAGAPGKAPTEFQGKSAAFGLRATEADKIIRELTGKYSPAAINSKVAVEDWPIIGGALGAATNTQLSESDQRAEQAQRDFINAVLRQESGAAIGASEFDNARKQYFPQPGNPPAVIKQKERARALAIQGLQSNAGRAALTAPGAQPAAAPAGGVKFLGFE